MVQYKINVLQELKHKGFSSTFLRQNKILSESAMSYFRNNKPVSLDTLERVCSLLERDISDILEFVPDPKTGKKINEAYRAAAENAVKKKGLSIEVFKHPKELHILKGNEVLFATPADEDMYREAINFLAGCSPEVDESPEEG